MMNPRLLVLTCSYFAATGCLGDAGGSSSGLSADDVYQGSADLECTPGPTGEIRVEFDCTTIVVESCVELSNVVVEYDDGTTERFEDLSGHEGSFGSADGRTITRVWVKAGNNASGAGPGYGTEFNAPDPCAAPEDPPAGDEPGGDEPGGEEAGPF